MGLFRRSKDKTEVSDFQTSQDYPPPNPSQIQNSAIIRNNMSIEERRNFDANLKAAKEKYISSNIERYHNNRNNYISEMKNFCSVSMNEKRKKGVGEYYAPTVYFDKQSNSEYTDVEHPMYKNAMLSNPFEFAFKETTELFKPNKQYTYDQAAVTTLYRSQRGYSEAGKTYGKVYSWTSERLNTRNYYINNKNTLPYTIAMKMLLTRFIEYIDDGDIGYLYDKFTSLSSSATKGEAGNVNRFFKTTYVASGGSSGRQKSEYINRSCRLIKQMEEFVPHLLELHKKYEHILAEDWGIILPTCNTSDLRSEYMLNEEMRGNCRHLYLERR